MENTDGGGQYRGFQYKLLLLFKIYRGEAESPKHYLSALKVLLQDLIY